MQSIEVALPHRSYPVLVGENLLGNPAAWADLLPDTPLIVVSNETVAPLYLAKLKQALSGRACEELVLPDGETSKNSDNWLRIIEFLASSGAGRDACLIALGGGVTGDLCGFAAATWMRGIDFIQAPTTLLAQVDAAVGGKTAINIEAGKNLVGAFHQPRAVVADIGSLDTLPDREYRAGLAEVVKYGAIMDADFVVALESSIEELGARHREVLTDVVSASIRYKAEVVSRDEKEAGLRAILNFGHSFAHALEAMTDYERWLHGEAVAMGMVIAARLSELRALSQPGFAERLGKLLQALQLPVTIPPNIDSTDMLDRMLLDKKNLSGRRRLVLLEAPGRAIVDDASSEEMIREAIELSR